VMCKLMQVEQNPDKIFAAHVAEWALLVGYTRESKGTVECGPSCFFFGVDR